MDKEIIPLRTLLHAFPGIPVTEAKELIASGEIHSYPEDTILCTENAFENIFYIILDGKVIVTKAIAEGQERVLKTLSENDFFGEMALIQDAPRAATVTTLTPTTVLEIKKDAFNELMQKSASMARAMVREVVRRLRENDQMAIEDLRLKASELAAAYIQLADLDYARRQFLTTIAHELRTPLTAAAGYLQMIETGLAHGMSLDIGMQQTTVRSASRSLQDIIKLVNDILFIQEMDLILLRIEPVDLAAILETLVERQRAAAAQYQVNLLLKLDEHLPTVQGDANNLERAFSAILENAIKFSPDGGDVTIRATTKWDQVRIVIQDHGVGIPAEDLPHVFDRFFHLDQVGGHMFRGVGLGLSIARQVFEQLGGAIQIESQLGEGTLVRVFLNVAG